MVIPSSCHSCGKYVQPDAAFCQHCGAEQERDVPAPVHEPEPTEVACRNCGAVSSSEALYCKECGTLLEEPRPAVEAPPAGPHSFSCPRCSTSNHRGSVYCYSCGYPLEGARPASEGQLVSPSGEVIGRPAGFWIRLVAAIVDGLILSISAGIVFGIAGEAPSSFLNIAIGAAYSIIGWSVWSTTIGKRIFNLYVVRPDGSKVDAPRAVLRYVGTFLSLILLLIGYLMVAFRRDKRALHDLIADTYVVIRS